MTASRRSLWPREHGAYAQLGAPLAGALLVRMPTLASACLALAACLAFVANEPLLVVLGHRGARVRASHGKRATTRLAVIASASAACALAGLWLGSPATRVTAAIAAVPALALVVLAWRRHQHSLAGELVAAIAFAAAGAPVLVASGAGMCEALAVWGTWSVGYACCVAAVHRVLARHRRPAGWLDAALAAALVVTALGCLVASRRDPATLAALPLIAAALALVVHPPRATRLRAVGVALVGASLVSNVVLVVASAAV